MIKLPPTVWRWLWPLLIALVTALLVIWIFSPLVDVPISEPVVQRAPASMPAEREGNRSEPPSGTARQDADGEGGAEPAGEDGAS